MNEQNYDNYKYGDSYYNADKYQVGCSDQFQQPTERYQSSLQDDYPYDIRSYSQQFQQISQFDIDDISSHFQRLEIDQYSDMYHQIEYNKNEQIWTPPLRAEPFEARPYRILNQETTITKAAIALPGITVLSQTQNYKDTKYFQNSESIPIEQVFRKQNMPPIEDQQDQLDEEPAPLQAASDKYYKKFDFFYKRTCFRLMAEYYKQTFQPYQKLWIEQRRKTDLKVLIQQYAEANFQQVLNALKGSNQELFMGMLSMVVLSHRHNKEDTIAKKDERLDLDFSLVRDTMYKYSKRVQERFFKVPCLSFLFLSFATSANGKGLTEWTLKCLSSAMKRFNS
ncbi:hypothetical protein FGO68_gene16530 [Halteria grandinella]|uniref:Uncharacterized protein n=1 Tax=Halteria grandinella TaxID=5974 RepID=A0A8J8NV71_HALGN|nr:hypothetical protein FGO68_gene16530 [Halteria grandinella]